MNYTQVCQSKFRAILASGQPEDQQVMAFSAYIETVAEEQG
jgi:hypothetical protein